MTFADDSEAEYTVEANAARYAFAAVVLGVAFFASALILLVRGMLG